MNKQINKEICNFKKTNFLGLTTRQTFAAIGLVICIFIASFVEATYVGGEITSVFLYLLAFLFVIIGFYSKDGLNGESFILVVLRFVLMPKDLSVFDKIIKEGSIREVKAIEEYEEEKDA